MATHKTAVVSPRLTAAAELKPQLLQHSRRAVEHVSPRLTAAAELKRVLCTNTN